MNNCNLLCFSNTGDTVQWIQTKMVTCNMVILKNRIDYFSVETSFCQFSNMASSGLKMWKRYVEDTCVVIKSAHKQEFMEHINSIDPHIQFTSEDSKPDGSMPFLDMLITPTEDGRLNTTVYRKPTHADMYLKWDSHHPISSKYSVVGTLHHRAKTICSSPHMLQKEEDHLSNILTRCKYPTWAINSVKMKMRTPAQKKKNNNSTNTKQNCQKPYTIVPYYQGLSESVKTTCNKHGVQVYFRGGVTIKNLLMTPKDQDPMMKKCGVIYRYKCDRVECDEEYIESLPEHLEKGSKNTRRPHPPSMTTVTPLVTWLA